MPHEDVLRTQERLERATSCLFGRGTLPERFEYFKVSFGAWLTGPRLFLDVEELKLFDEATGLMLPSGEFGGPWRAMSERDMEQCAELWRQLLIRLSRRAGAVVS